MTHDDEIQQFLDRRDYDRAFDLMVRVYKDRVFGLAYSMAGSATAAEDAAQEVFLRVWRALPYFAARSSLSTWIYAITRNTCLNLRSGAHERAAALRDYSGHDLPAPSHDPDAALLVRELLHRLPHEYREVVTLYYLGDRSCEEVASQLGMPPGTVKTYLHRARRMLAEAVAQEAKPRGAQ